MRACIYGAGAMGTVLGAFMARAGEDVELVTRNLSHVAALNAAGARIGGADGGELFTCRVKALPPSAMSGRYDIVFLMTKQRDNAQTVRYISNFLAPAAPSARFRTVCPKIPSRRSSAGRIPSAVPCRGEPRSFSPDTC